MKQKILKSIFIIIILFTAKNIQSQDYLEQNSGVTTRLNSVCLTPNSYSFRVWICGNNGVVLKTTNEGMNWINVSGSGIPDTVDLVNIFSVDTNLAVTAGYSNFSTSVYRTSNTGISWQRVFEQQGGFINAIWMKNRNEGFMYGDPVGNRWSLWKTSNGGINWDSSGMNLKQTGSETGWNNSLYIKTNEIWFGTNNYRIYHSTDFGNVWTFITVNEPNTYAIWFSTAWDPSNLYGYRGSSNIYKTSNGGISWAMMNCPGSGRFSGICTGIHGSPSLPPPPVVSYAVRSDNHIYQSIYMDDWTIDYTAPSGNYTHVGINLLIPYYNWAIRSDGGITRIQTSYAGIKNKGSEIPKHFSLSQNYPNPFNPVTFINYQLAVTDQVKLVIYDVLGSVIEVLVNEKQTPGTYEAEWDGTNYPSGVYFYKLITADYTETRKMVLIK